MAAMPVPPIRPSRGPLPPSDRGRGRRTITLVVALTALAVVAAGCSHSDEGPVAERSERSSGGPSTTGPSDGSDDPDTPDGPDTTDESPVEDRIRVEVLSSQPDRVSGPEARVRVTPARGDEPTDLTITLGDADVTSQLSPVGADDGSSPRSLEGVVTGLAEGTNTLTVTGGNDDDTVAQRLRSWPLEGPMISGPHLPLAACSTEEHGLGAPTDESCSAPVRVVWRYVTTDGAVEELPDPADRPDDLATARIDGEDVPLLVRHETGVVNRSVYEIATVDPSPGGDDTTEGDAAQDDAVWNGRLLYRFGDGCGATFGQGVSDVEVLDPTYLAQGYAVATATFNTGAVQCNDVVSAETTMMVKERFIEAFGGPDVTIGEGTGGGAAQLHLIAQNYPGLLDGGVALAPLPDIVTAYATMTDCSLLARHHRSPEGQALTTAQRTAINGHATDRACDRWEETYGGLVNPTEGCDAGIDPEQLYDVTENPGGLRCTLQDVNANQYGRNDGTGEAVRPLDTVGVQYGLDALNEGIIDVDQFTELNEAIGGYDPDGVHQPERHEADPEDVLRAYESGRVSTGVGDQTKIPIIEVDVYDDPAGSVTDRVRAFSLRDRLTYGAPPESVPGFQIWTRLPGENGENGEDGDPAGRDAVAVVAEWLDALAEDREGGERFAALARTRPDNAVDNCLPEGATTPIGGVGIYDEAGPCADDHVVSGDPRLAAGVPLANDVLKCQLKPVDALDYDVSLTPEQTDRLDEVFPDGVCDWGAPGVGQTVPSMPDRSYDDVETPADLA
ncbi:DUF6351 family protein [soil metagenome]